MGTGSFIIHIKTEDFYNDIFLMMLKNGSIQAIVIKMIKDHYQSEKNKKVIAMFKDELGGKIMDKICGPQS